MKHLTSNNVEGRFQEATRFHKAGQFHQAAQLYQGILRHTKDHIGSLNGLGILILQHGDKLKAIELFEKIILLQPNFQPALENLGRGYREIGEISNAEKCFKKLIKKAPKSALAHKEMGLCYLADDKHKLAVQSFKKAISFDPSDSSHYYQLGQALLGIGNFDEAIVSFRSALDINPAYGQAWHGISTIKKFKLVDDKDLVLMLAQVNSPQTSKISRMCLGFALGKAYNDLADYDNAFLYYKLANDIKFSETKNYNIESVVERLNKIRTVSTSQNTLPINNADCDSRPIFIIGMPRSGSTLLEQILGRHSKISNAGEIYSFHQNVKEFEQSTDCLYPELLNISNENISQIGKKYLKMIQINGSKNSFITDKMLGNFQYVGMIHKIFPNAVIIHNQRDPIDTCLSCYFNLFSSGYDYSYNLDWLEKYYMGYFGLMKHWQEILPKDRIINIRYENLVDDPKEVISSVLSRCGLEWEDKCIDAHKSKRIVNTASVVQVRTPINSRSVSRWKNFERQLQPFVNKFMKLN